jgi:NfeD-like C-terminal, partner-binding
MLPPKPKKRRISKQIASLLPSGRNAQRESLSGLLAKVIRPIQINQPGIVKFRGRHWRAVCRHDVTLKPNDLVKVVSCRGRVLIVEPTLIGSVQRHNQNEADRDDRGVETTVVMSDITVRDLAQLAQQGKAFDFLMDEPDLYTDEDGESVW